MPLLAPLKTCECGCGCARVFVGGYVGVCMCVCVGGGGEAARIECGGSNKLPHFHFTWCVSPDIALGCINVNRAAPPLLHRCFIFSYKHNPWRAPGFAPVGDACGLAGGTPWGAEVGEAGDYTNTTYAHHGMNGTTLPPMDTGVVWTIGLEAEVTWQVGVAGRHSVCLSACLSTWVCVLSVLSSTCNQWRRCVQVHPLCQLKKCSFLSVCLVHRPRVISTDVADRCILFL
jgi:hypothetical protein